MVFNAVYASVELIESGPLPIGIPDLIERNPLLPINVVPITEQTTKIQSRCTAKIKKNQIVVKNLWTVAQWWALSESHPLRLYFGVFQPSTYRITHNWWTQTDHRKLPQQDHSIIQSNQSSCNPTNPVTIAAHNVPWNIEQEDGQLQGSKMNPDSTWVEWSRKDKRR